MPKKLLALALMLISLAALWLIAGDSAGQPHLSELYAEPAVLEEIISARQAHDFTDIYSPLYTGLRFNGYDLFSDEGNGMLLYSLIDGDPRAYDPQVDLITDTGAKVLVSGQTITDEMIRENGSIDLLIYTDEEYALFELKCTTLPVIEIGRDPNTITARHNTTLRLFDNRAEAVNHLFTTDTAIWVRGRNSAIYPKKGYRLSLYTESVGGNRRKNHTSFLGMRSDEDWILNAMYNDPHKIRDVISTNLWYDSCAGNNQWNIKNGIRYQYVEVFFAHEYYGIYALGSPMDTKQIPLKVGEHTYKKVDPAISELQIDFDAEGPVLGYDYRGSNLMMPDWEPLKQYYRILMNAEQYDPETLFSIADVDNSIDIYLFLNLIQGIDHAHLYGGNIIYNLFLTSKKNSDGQSTILYTPWDMDRTWGLDFGDILMLDPERSVIMDTNIATILLQAKNSEMLDRVHKRYQELRTDLWSDEAMTQLIHSYNSALFESGAYARDYKKWYSDGTAMVQVRPFDSLDSFCDYVIARLECMDSFVNNLP